MENNNNITRNQPDPMNLAPFQSQGPLKLNPNQGQYKYYYDALVDNFGGTSRLYDSTKDPNTKHFKGPMLTNDGYISQENIDIRSNAITFGAAYVDSCHDDIDDNDFVPCAIVDTRNAGLLYAVEDEDGNLKSVGPVSHACFVGGTNRPVAVLIPLNGDIAPITDGMKILNDVEKTYRESMNDIDIAKGSPRAELPKAPFENDEDQDNFENFKIPERFI